MNQDEFSRAAQMQLFLAALNEHNAAVWLGNDALITAARQKVTDQAEALLNAQETLIIGEKARMR